MLFFLDSNCSHLG